jgi:hypothetical protein
VHETSFNGKPFNSGVFKRNNNLFGMRYGSETQKWAVGNGKGEDSKGQAVYKSWYHSIMGYFYWCKINGVKTKGFVDTLIANWKPGDLQYKTKWLAHHAKTWKFARYLYGIIFITIIVTIYAIRYKKTKSKGVRWSRQR